MNFLGTQKAVVRVNPAVPLRNILPVVCEKCDLNHENVTLLKDVISKEELDMSRSLNDLGIKELYAWSSKQGTVTFQSFILLLIIYLFNLISMYFLIRRELHIKEL